MRTRRIMKEKVLTTVVTFETTTQDSCVKWKDL